jgi:hypothetical protein
MIVQRVTAYVTRREINSDRSRATQRRGRLLLILGLLLSLTSILALDFIGPSTAQRRQRRRPVAPTRPGIDYSKFSHATEKHRGECVTCHKVPTKNWQRVGDFPDVADYPDHEACLSCGGSSFAEQARPFARSVTCGPRRAKISVTHFGIPQRLNNSRLSFLMTSTRM